MEFKIKLDKLNSTFSLPVEIADKHSKLAGALQLRAVIYCYRNLTSAVNPEKLAEELSVSVADAYDALMFWRELGVLECDCPAQKEETKQKSVSKNIAVQKPVKPSRSEIAKRGFESPEIAFLLREAQQKFGRTLKQSESSVLVWLYDDLGLEASVILMAVEYALKAEKCNISFIEKIGKTWAENGVETVSDAEQCIIELNKARSCWNVMRNAFGLDWRAPSDSEQKLAVLALDEWKMPKEVLKAAYDICIDNVGKYKATYIKTVLTSWHKNGVKSLEDIEKLNTSDEKAKTAQGKNGNKNSYAAYDISLLDKMIDGE